MGVGVCVVLDREGQVEVERVEREREGERAMQLVGWLVTQRTRRALSTI